jgi:hypothetical protein
MGRTGHMSGSPEYVIVTSLAAIPGLLAETRAPQWYEIATGILAIPATVIGLVYSFILIKKTRLEARKTELEIREKESQLQQLAIVQPEVVHELLGPATANRLALYLILRFVLLYLILAAWGLIDDVYNVVFTGIIAGAQSMWHLTLEGWIVVPIVVLQKLPKVGYWIVFFALAWPLFKDVNATLGLDLRRLFRIGPSGKNYPSDQERDG